jgi:putative ABC transport system ATP-binding protein
VHYQGELEVAGAQLNGLSDRKLSDHRNRNVGLVFQSFHLVPQFSALENVALPAFFRRQEAPRTAAVHARAEALLEKVGLREKKARYPRQLSGGERQRIAIARALFFEPPLLLCDEPTGNLDAATGAEIIRLFQTLHREGLTVVAVTHEERLSAVAQRVLKISQGRLS